MGKPLLKESSGYTKEDLEQFSLGTNGSGELDMLKGLSDALFNIQSAGVALEGNLKNFEKSKNPEYALRIFESNQSFFVHLSDIFSLTHRVLKKAVKEKQRKQEIATEKEKKEEANK